MTSPARADWSGAWSGPRPAFAEVEEPPLGQRKVGLWEASRADLSPGRRMRVFAQLVKGFAGGKEVRVLDNPRITFVRPITYERLLRGIEKSTIFRPIYEALDHLPLRCREGRAESTGVLDSIWPWGDAPFNAELHQGLQDLGYQVASDVSAACKAFDNPDLYFPGVDYGIEPVSEEHVRLTIWAMQRELDRETRPLGETGPKLPPAPLAELPQRVQRALVERRRLRFRQWGITHDDWAANRWSLWRVPIDSTWQPPWDRTHALRPDLRG